MRGYNIFPMQVLLTMHLHYLTLCNMSNHTLLEKNINSNILQLQVSYVCTTSQRIHKTFRYQVNKTMSTLFDHLTMKFTNNSYNTNKTSVFLLMMFYKDNKVIIFKYGKKTIYSLNVSSVCIVYLCLHQKKVSNKKILFKNTTFNNLSVIRIHNFLKNIISCCEFSRGQMFKVVLSCCQYNIITC